MPAGLAGGATVAEEVSLRVRRLGHALDLPLPVAASPGSAGVDLRAALGEPLRLDPGEWRAVPTGLVLEIPPGFEGQVRPRSGLALRHGITLLNSPGTIDSDYRGEVKVILVNHGREPFTVRRGERIAQLLVCPARRIRWRELEPPRPTSRGAGGFGSTGRG
jgi:dUTP pyrophosphatase